MTNTIKVKRGDLQKEAMVNVVNDLWYFITDYATDAKGYLVEVKGDNGTWYQVAKVKGLF
jgi:transcriptional regulator CtsR